jgi:hypothetical protein
MNRVILTINKFIMNPADIRIYRAAMKDTPEVQVLIKGLGTKDKEFVTSDVIASKEFQELAKKREAEEGEELSKIAQTFSLRPSLTLTEQNLVETFYTVEEGDKWELTRIKENTSEIIANPNPEPEPEQE